MDSVEGKLHRNTTIKSPANVVVDRICPGRHLAAGSIWIAVAMIFATVQISKAKDEIGNEITPELDFETGITRCAEFAHAYAMF